MAKDFPKLARNVNLQIQEAAHTTNRINPRKFRPRHIIIKLLKTKDI